MANGNSAATTAIAARNRPGSPAPARPRDEAEAGSIIKKATPFKPDSIEGRLAVGALPVNTSLGQWRPIGPGNFGGKVYSVAVDPTNTKYIYAAYEVGGLWGTTNGGTSWRSLYNRFADVAFSSVKTHPTIHGLVAAGLIAYGEGYFHSFNQHVGIALSTDAGNTWKLIGPTTDATATVWDIAFGDSTGQVIYAATQNGLYKTTNQGGTWTKILAYTGNEFFNSRASFWVDPLNSNTLLLADNVIGVQRSTDAGSTWTEVDNWVLPATQQNATLLAWSTGATVYAYAFTNGTNTTLSTYKSTDEGATWTATATTNAFNQGMYDMAIAVDPFDTNHVLIDGSHLQISTDGLATLGPDLGYAPGPDCESIVFDPKHKGVIYDGNDEGVHKSTDGGTTWARFDTGVLTTKIIGGSTYGVGTDGVIHTHPADYGSQQYVPGFGYRWNFHEGGEYQSGWVNPHDPGNVYSSDQALTQEPTATQPYQVINPGGPGKTTIGVDSLEFDPVDANTIYFGNPNGLYKSTNRGSSWTGPLVTGSGGIKLVRVVPTNTQHVYATDSGNIYYSTDGGATFTKGAAISANSISVSSLDENSPYIATGDGLYFSINGGQTVSKLVNFPSVSVALVIADPVVPANVYAALSNTGVLVSTDGGGTWAQLGSQLPLVQPNWMSLSGRNLYLGTGADVWELNLQGLGTCSQITLNPPALTLPSSAGTYPVELFLTSICPWTATSGASWASIKTYGTKGHSILYVAVTDNSTGSIRNSTLTIAGQTVKITQLGGPNPIGNGKVVTLSKGNSCVTVSGTALKMAACSSTNTKQQFTLQAFTGDISSGSKVESYYGGPAYCLANSGSYVDVFNDELQIGTAITMYPGGCNINEGFFLEPQTSGAWKLAGFDSLLCMAPTSTGTTQQVCTSTTGFTLTLK
jgi:photosystem II stability/assembly factor-like uncharacterized protein